MGMREMAAERLSSVAGVGLGLLLGGAGEGEGVVAAGDA